MENAIAKIPVLRLIGESSSKIEDVVAREFPLTIILNNQELATLLCSPSNLKQLAIGFLFSEGLIKSKDEIKKLTLDEQRGVIRVETEEASELARDILFK